MPRFTLQEFLTSVTMGCIGVGVLCILVTSPWNHFPLMFLMYFGSAALIGGAIGMLCRFPVLGALLGVAMAFAIAVFAWLFLLPSL